MRWEGDLEGNENPAKITIDEEKEVIAVFEKNPHTLAVVIEGEGEVNQMILPTKETEYAYGSVIQLTAVPKHGWIFTRWKGDRKSVVKGKSEEIGVRGEGTVKESGSY